ncbi:hypothetical protein SAMN05444377_101239 [Flavobacterium fontis]|uniref:Uncharacterized protein n=1 Tax=Flavobacterium fontis TaxID=1124188 RepID=A0A1M4WBD6_9FLAO|nr:hypothetical protein [Flavobacterium fontis]SHE78485.1 hypothetical protein SAMN05444377_101239 [Flavobacterium fontis]
MISTEQINYLKAVSVFTDGYGGSLGKDGNSLCSYMVPLASSKLGYDYYELYRTNSNRYGFRIVTMNGIKTICRTESYHFDEKLNFNQWYELIGITAREHFMKEEYSAFKLGYTKSNSGCLGSVITIAILISFTIIFS